MKLLVILLLPISLFAQSGNVIDEFGHRYLTWKNTEAADTMSDILRTGLMFSPIFASAFQDNPEKKIVQSAGVLAINYGITTGIKLLTKRERPDKSNRMSFQSGHASTSFAGATMTCMMWQSKQGCTMLYTLAGLASLSRVFAQKHFLTDIIFGAGIGYANSTFFPTVVFKW